MRPSKIYYSILGFEPLKFYIFQSLFSLLLKLILFSLVFDFFKPIFVFEAIRSWAAHWTSVAYKIVLILLLLLPVMLILWYVHWMFYICSWGLFINHVTRWPLSLNALMRPKSWHVNSPRTSSQIPHALLC